MSAQVAADLRAAAEVLRRDGWTRGSFRDPDSGCRCAAGAIPECEWGSRRWREAVVVFGDHVGVGPWPVAVYRWNDDEDRTADEVIAALEAAADAAEADGV